MIRAVISTIMAVYAFLFILLSHAALIACRYGEHHNEITARENLERVNMGSIYDKLPDRCPEVRLIQ